MDSTAVSNLQQSVGIATVSYDDSVGHEVPGIDSLIEFLNIQYPLTFSHLECDTVNSHSLLLSWKGSDHRLKPVILYAHMDVVPALEDSANGWRFDAFPSLPDYDTVRGRGTVDDKLGVIGILEATERLMKRGYCPKRDIYIALGHDEETGGLQGASMIAKELEKKGVKASWLLDEGGMVAEGIVPFVKNPVALVMIAEKGYMTVELTVESNGGHSSFPPKDSPIDIIAGAIMRLKENPAEKSISGTVATFMEHAGPAMKFPYNAVFANPWLFSSLIMNEYEKIPEGNATIRTTRAWTMSHAGMKENVLPAHASATVNLRITPGSSIKEELDEIIKVVDDPRVKFRVHPGSMEPIAPSRLDSEGFIQISDAIRRTFPDAVVAPNLSIASTDSRHFEKVTEQRYRFLPVRMSREILAGMHGKNERLPAKDFCESILFYETLLGSQ
ncbi:MAG: M20/M25/M40 family metallo-hydrolase [Bacteroidota bacterium]